MQLKGTYRGRRLARRPLATLAALAGRRLAALPTAHDAVDAASACAS